MLSHTQDTIHTQPVIPPADQSAPRIIQSSASLGWHGIEVQSCLEPAQSDRWVEPVSLDITLMLLMHGATRLIEHGCDTCKGIDIRPGDLLLKPAGIVTPDLRRESPGREPVQTLRLALSRSLFRQSVEALSGRDPDHVQLAGLAGFQDPLLAQIGLALWREVQSPSSSGAIYAQAAAHMLAVHLLRFYTLEPVAVEERTGGLTPRQLNRVIEYVQTCLNQPLSLAELADQAGFSPYHFARLFRQSMGESPHQYVLRCRVERARRLLEDPALPIARVAVDCGFADQSHLTQAFRRITGLTPRAFRRAL